MIVNDNYKYQETGSIPVRATIDNQAITQKCRRIDLRHFPLAARETGLHIECHAHAGAGTNRPNFTAAIFNAISHQTVGPKDHERLQVVVRANIADSELGGLLPRDASRILGAARAK